ncbi:MAG: hypothetical protein RLZZ488_1913 [Pseudomonadota bacterium]|jgi:hypothetical protein
MRRKYIGTLFLALGVAQGCMNQADKPRIAKTLSLDSVPSLPRVDASTLLISDIQVVQFQDPKLNGAIQPLVDFRYSGSAEYVEVATCVDSETACGEPKRIFQTQATLANGPSGAKVYVKMRACVDPSRATGASNCGEWFQSSYTQWAVIDRKAAAYQEEKEAIEIATNELRQQLSLLLKLKTDRALKCKPATAEQKAALEADKALADSLAKLGQGAIGIIADALAKGSGKCLEVAKQEAEKQKAKEQEEKAPATTPEPAPAPSSPAAFEPPVIALVGSASSNASMIGPNGLSSQNLKLVVDKLIEGLQKRPAASSNEAVAQCIAEQTKSMPGKITLNDVGAILPDLAGAIFDFANAGRAVALEGICIDNLGKKLEESIQVANDSAKTLAAQLQARTARNEAKLNGGNP